MDSAVTCRTLTLGFTPFFVSKVLYPSSTTSPIGPLWWIPEGVVYAFKATFPLSSLLSLFFVVPGEHVVTCPTLFKSWATAAQIQTAPVRFS